MLGDLSDGTGARVAVFGRNKSKEKKARRKHGSGVARDKTATLTSTEEKGVANGIGGERMDDRRLGRGRLRARSATGGAIEVRLCPCQLAERAPANFTIYFLKRFSKAWRASSGRDGAMGAAGILLGCV